MMTVKQEAVFKNLIDYVDRHNLQVQLYSGCAEPGYDDIPVLAADWNGPSISGNSDYTHKNGKQELTNRGKERYRLYKLGGFIDDFFGSDVSKEWDDEWTSCGECGKAIRTNPDSYSWEPNFVQSDYGLVCADCASEDDLADYTNTTDRAIPSWMHDIANKAGFVCAFDDPYLFVSCKRFQTGFHPGQNDTPQEALQELYDLCEGKEFFKKKYDYLFAITDKGQFDISWTVLIREREED